LTLSLSLALFLFLPSTPFGFS
jgi:hypothetical protein